ncbi:halo transducer protein [Halorarum halobium]|uniref:halo transducer protein n=1 Tax=Halorarum halobium TaxID=3075121 RepID=UPI0028AABAD5|nr:halo transducer protein [Halobaculum sp. XH14]
MSRPQAVVGRTTEEAVETILAADGTRERDAVRAALDPVTEDGVVTEAAVESAVSDTSKVVATAETRVELARIEHEEAREAAEPVADLEVVSARLDEAADRLAAVEARRDDLSRDLGSPVERLNDPTAAYELAVELRAVASNAQGVVRTADDLQTDLEQVESWLTSPARRYDEFGEDVSFAAESLAELEAAAQALPETTAEPAVEWADASMRTRVLNCVVADLRAELAELREWADREDEPFREALVSDVDALADRREALAAELDGLARPAWRDRFGEELAALGDELAGVDAPVDWAAVEAASETHRARVRGDAGSPATDGDA